MKIYPGEVYHLSIHGLWVIDISSRRINLPEEMENKYKSITYLYMQHETFCE